MADGHDAHDDRVDLAETFAEVARALLAADSVGETLQRICTLAVVTIDGCRHAGISLVDRERIETRGSSGELPAAVDRIQYETGEGPCLDAIRHHETLHVDDLAQESRWPAFASQVAAETGVRSMIAFRLFAEQDTMGALSLYAEQPHAFDEEAARVGAVFAAHAAVALVGARRSRQKDEAIRTRDVIGQAKGILMARENISEDEAFDLLRRASQRMNVKLRTVADQVAHPDSASPPSSTA